jgi:hypothetical protein
MLPPSNSPEITRIVDERITRSENSLKELMNARFAAVDVRLDGLEKRLISFSP